MRKPRRGDEGVGGPRTSACSPAVPRGKCGASSYSYPVGTSPGLLTKRTSDWRVRSDRPIPLKSKITHRSCALSKPPRPTHCWLLFFLRLRSAMDSGDPLVTPSEEAPE